jgi:hypothetical protein
MRRIVLSGAVAVFGVVTSVHAEFVNFTYSQTDATSRSGSVAPFTVAGHSFPATPMPAATVLSPGGAAPSGFVGVITAMAGSANEANQAVGLLFSGVLTATSTDGFLFDIPLLFVPKQTQSPDINDYTWNVVFGDSVANGIDTVSSTAPRFAMWYSRDDVIDAVETPGTFQRYTQTALTFAAGQSTFTNTDTTTTAIKDAVDGGDPQGTDAAGRNLAFYFGWRDQGAITPSTILVDDFTVGGLLNANEGTLRPVPEPSAALLACAGVTLLLRRRGR